MLHLHLKALGENEGQERLKSLFHKGDEFLKNVLQIMGR